ncbi:hypothetical protein F1643_03740 [Azospirillum sp. INR13]|uniref:hypothetical protein n=1 Tax=Azospirillum sp. INR13 TaxID=2596919 RepID=UPI00189213FD|nr:hypothetical protein [Azospirillum sp. INR13]MBF5093737.1 hypothetical protein [Azospirillum sp. INR13]
MAAKRWWMGDPHECFWLEATDRDDIGMDLRAPLADAKGRDNWRYTLFREARPGDIVLHYDGKVAAITGWSTVAGPAASQPITWAARGSYARKRGAQAVELPGYSVPLRDLTRLATPITLAAIRKQKDRLITLTQSLQQAAGKAPLYFPFELSDRPVRPMQGYAFKLPAAFLALFGLDTIVAPSPTFLLSTSRAEIRRYFDRWRRALLEDAVREEGLWRLPGERFVFSNQDERASTRLGPRTTLGVDPLGHYWAVQINEAETPGDANVTSAIALDRSGRPYLLRQGRLSARRKDEQPVSFETFRRLTGAMPAAVANGDTRIKRDWYIVTALDISSEEIRRNTARFVDLCMVARLQGKGAGDPEDLAVLETLWSGDETGGTYVVPGRPASDPREVQRFQGEVWQHMAALLRAHGASVDKPRHAKGYEVDAEVVKAERRLLIEIKSGASAAEVYGGLGQLQLYRKLLPRLEHHEPVLLLPRLPSPALAEAVRACGVTLVTFALQVKGKRLAVTFSETFYETCGIPALASETA